ncbi:hypothetical protein [Acaryochloris sp. CCMEE 5410]|uniref:hypothetical protein n=1 Tax=Acaryochloris sp. CCMEE 5410 TaxID=310037 RepID=UPI0002485148|nr:hypothetical protein [Acaryochloris sp. CCMEE 5410]KAI9130119.1 hypothetical protein ON05_031320 [Acaryochloris sp. CCMEE 5410]
MKFNLQRLQHGLQPGFVFKVKPESIHWDREDRYFYAIPSHYCSSQCEIGDCWIVDQSGNIHPGYCNSPIPLCRDALEYPAVGIVSLEQEPHEQEIQHVY